MHVHTHKCVCAYVKVSGQLRVSPCFLRQRLFKPKSRAQGSSWPALQEVPLIFLSLLHLIQFLNTCQHAQLLSGFCDSKFRFFCLHRQHFTQVLNFDHAILSFCLVFLRFMSIYVSVSVLCMCMLCVCRCGQKPEVGFRSFGNKAGCVPPINQTQVLCKSIAEASLQSQHFIFQMKEGSKRDRGETKYMKQI